MFNAGSLPIRSIGQQFIAIGIPQTRFYTHLPLKKCSLSPLLQLGTRSHILHGRWWFLAPHLSFGLRLQTPC